MLGFFLVCGNKSYR